MIKYLNQNGRNQRMEKVFEAVLGLMDLFLTGFEVWIVFNYWLKSMPSHSKLWYFF